MLVKVYTPHTESITRLRNIVIEFTDKVYK